MQFLTIKDPDDNKIEDALNDDEYISIGIDLGTTNSLVGLFNKENNRIEVIKDIYGKELVPSKVAFASNNVFIGNQLLFKNMGINPIIISSIKRLMGKNLTDIEDETLPFNIDYEKSKNDGKNIYIKCFNSESKDKLSLTPIEISAKILGYLKDMAEKQTGKIANKVVITVPAYFDDAARNATKLACKLVNLEPIRLINEPTAAALAYGLDKKADGIFLIYDLGGGTFDVSVLRMNKGIFQVISSLGDSRLGGDDIDMIIVNYILAKNNIKLGDNVYQTNLLLKEQAKKVKEELTFSDKANFNIILDGIEISYWMQKDEFEEIIAPIIDKTISITKQALFDAENKNVSIDNIVLVGGSTRIPIISKKLEQIFKVKPLSNIDPDKVVMFGAAIQSHALTHGSGNLLLDITPLSLGIEIMGGIVEKIVERNTTLPVMVAKEFTTYKDGQTAMKIHIVQGERQMVSQNRSLAEFELKNIPPMKAGIPRIRIIFQVDLDGIVTVSAEELTTNTKQEIQIKPSYGLDSDKIKDMLISAMDNAKDDMRMRILAIAKVNAEEVLIKTKSALDDDADVLTDNELEEIKENMDLISGLIKNSDNASEIDNGVNDFEKILEKFAEKRIEKTVKALMKGTRLDDLEKHGSK